MIAMRYRRSRSIWEARVFFTMVGVTSALLAQGRDGGSAPKAAAEAQLSGDAARGQTILEGRGACLTCHRVKDRGSRLGPDLSDIGLRSRDSLEKALLAPSPEAQPQNRLYRVVTSDGVAITGKLFNQNISSIQMLDSKEQFRSIQRSNLKEQGFVQPPPMPSYEGKLSREELADVVAYLQSLKGAVKQ